MGAVPTCHSANRNHLSWTISEKSPNPTWLQRSYFRKCKAGSMFTLVIPLAALPLTDHIQVLGTSEGKALLSSLAFSSNRHSTKDRILGSSILEHITVSLYYRKTDTFMMPKVGCRPAVNPSSVLVPLRGALKRRPQPWAKLLPSAG